MSKIKNLYDLPEIMWQIDSNYKLKNNFQKFALVVLRRLYNKNVYIGLDCIDENLFDIDAIVDYLKIVDEECLDDPEFSKVILGKKKNISKQLGIATEPFSVEKDYYTAKGEVTLGISYIPGSSIDKPNTIRLEISEDINRSKKFINGIIDISSDGKIKIGNFDEMIYSELSNGKGYSVREFNSNINESSIDVDTLDELKELFMNIFELADLKPKQDQKNKTKRLKR